MADYVGKNSKEYILTDKGFRFLQQIDHSYAVRHPGYLPVAHQLTEQAAPKSGNVDRRSLKEFIWIFPYLGIVALVVSLLQVYPSLVLAGPDRMVVNASFVSSLSITAVLAAAFLIMLRPQVLPGGTRRVFVVTVISVIAVNIFIFSGLDAQIGVISSVSYATQLIANASLISSISITAVLTVAFLVMLRRQLMPSGVKGLTFSTLIVLTVVIVNIFVFSGLDAQLAMNRVVY